jgi:hypothetical protein
MFRWRRKENYQDQDDIDKERKDIDKVHVCIYCLGNVELNFFTKDMTRWRKVLQVVSFNFKANGCIECHL